MGVEVHGLTNFYATGNGVAAARLVAERLRATWPSLRGQAVLGIGHAAPYLDLWRGEAARCVALTPAHLGPPPKGLAGVLAAEEESLPFPDLCFDRVLLVHGLEMAENARRLLREVWRVLKDDGRLLVVAPNRRGLWAHAEHTPFGHGQPYSPGQVTRLLERHMFRVEQRDAALYVPPFAPFLRAGAAWERSGRAIWPARYAGLAIVEAEKDLFAGMPAGRVAVARQVLADA
ncbi:methyltransferase domain-containing protein [Roseomonas sp. PWR1]|uniref:Methyltransferase domain-containing protein n=1 Tax=Roseomonas nitratireducens TaxID=2820810 RepID=A0ABS4AU12_9PROT|nr:class I SAM-dependent methyltransferase [Neoroseomonas nitratireducens]MBP0464338.1 methyltransferase domain-containing protein [Neoroseomonas nitratireducens]